MSPRPLTVSNAEILDAAERVIGRRGPAHLTLADVGAEVGLAPATLVQRFGSKRGLLLAVDERGADAVTRVFHAARDVHASPLEALSVALVAMVRGIDTPGTLANHVAFLQMDLGDTEFHAHALRHARAMHASVRGLLDAAVEAGELPSCDTDRLARAVRGAFDGALISWAIYREGPLADWLRSDIAFLLDARRARP